jgi:hypothetical protein
VSGKLTHSNALASSNVIREMEVFVLYLEGYDFRRMVGILRQIAGFEVGDP